MVNHLMQKGPSPVKIEPLKRLLAKYPQRQDASYLEAGFIEGFRIPYQGP